MKISKILLDQNESFAEFLTDPKIKKSFSSSGSRSEWASHVANAKIYSEYVGLCTAVTDDGILTNDEIDLLYKWMDYRRQYLVSSELVLFKNILSGKSVDKYSVEFKSKLLQHLLQSAIRFGPKVIQGIYDEPETILFDGMEFVLTGGFYHGKKSEIGALILNRRGIVSPRIRKSTDYLVVGSEGSLDYKYGDHGDKIDLAIDSKNTYKPILILHEDFFINFILSPKS